MGLFSGKTKVYVSAITERMLEDKDFKYSSDYAMNDYLFHKDSLDLKNQPNLSDIMSDYVSNNLPNKYNKIYNFAKDTANYVFGLPKDSVLSKPVEQMNVIIKSYLEKLEGKPVTINYDYLGDRNYEHIAWTKLVEDYKYSGLNNELKTLSDEKGVPCYLYDGYVTYTQATHDEYVISEVEESNPVLGFSYGKCFDRIKDYARSHTSSKIGDKDIFTFIYHYKTSDGVIHKETKDIDLSWINPPIVEGSEMVTEPDWIQTGYIVDNEYKFFTYEFLSGKIFDIDSNLKIDDGVGEYYPRIYLRIDGVDTVESSDDVKKSHTIKIMKKLGLELEAVTKQVNKGIGKELSNVRGIYLDMAICINKVKDDSVLAEYLYRYFNKLYDAGSKDTTNKNMSLGIIQTIQDNQSSLIVKYNSVTKDVMTGVATNNAGGTLNVGDYCVINKDYIHTIYYQVDANSYITLAVDTLRVETRIKDKVAGNDSDDENLSIPLDRALISDLGIKERELLFNKCFCIEIHTRQVVKQKWYQTSIFKVILTLISIAISVFTAGTGAGISAMIQTVLTSIATSYAIGMAVDVFLKIAVKLGLSPEIAAIIMLVAAVVTMGKGINANTFKAANIMKALNKSFEVYNKSMQLQLIEINKQMKDFQKTAQQQDEILNAKQAMLTTGVVPIEFELLSSPTTHSLYINLGETPEQFYTRVLTNNVTNIALDYITNYTAMNLQLPKRTKLFETEDVESILLIK